MTTAPDATAPGSAPEAIVPHAIGPEAIGPEAIGPEAIGPEAIGPEGIGPAAIGSAAIVPDKKDWTWVLERRCPDCQFDASTVGRAAVPDLVRANAQAWRSLLTGDERLAVRRSPGAWSPLEYACHVRDVYQLGEHRLLLMLEEDDPTFDDWDQDAAAIAGGYLRQVPGLVGIGVGAAANRLAQLLERIPDGAWSRPGRRSNGSLFTVESFARYLVHDPVHHLWDMTGRTTAVGSAEPS